MEWINHRIKPKIHSKDLAIPIRKWHRNLSGPDTYFSNLTRKCLEKSETFCSPLQNSVFWNHRLVQNTVKKNKRKKVAKPHLKFGSPELWVLHYRGFWKFCLKSILGQFHFTYQQVNNKAVLFITFRNWLFFSDFLFGGT